MNTIADFDVKGLAAAIFAILALADGHDFAFLWFFLSGIGNDDPAANLFAFFNAAHDDAVMKRPNVYCHTPVMLLSVDEFRHNIANELLTSLTQY